MSLLWNPEEAATIVEMPLEVITIGTQNMGNGVYWLRAGTPLDEYFAVSNDEDAVYLVAEDFFFITTNPAQPKIVPLITAGYVDLNKAEAASGLTYTDDCLSALETAGIVLVDGVISTGGGSSGGGVLVVHAEDNEAGTASVLDKTWQEIFDAARTSVVVIAEIQGGDDSGIVTASYVYSVRTLPGTDLYKVVAMNGMGNEMNFLIYTATSANGYPEMIYE